MNRSGNDGLARRHKVQRWMSARRLTLALAGLLLTTTAASAIDVASQADWNTAVAAVAAAGPGSTVSINFTGGFVLGSSLATLQATNANVTVNITGNNQTINGGAAYQGIQVSGTNAPTVNISNLTIANTAAIGGAGQAGQAGYANAALSYGSGGGGGGGMGAGGGLFVDSGANVTLTSVNFIGNSATGGAGGNGGVAQNVAPSGTGGNGGAGGAMNNGGAVGGGSAGGNGGNNGLQGTAGNAGTAGNGGGGGGGSGTANSVTYTAPNSGGPAGSTGGGTGGSGGAGVTNYAGINGPGSDGGSGGSGGAARGGAVYVASGGTLTILDTGVSGATATGGAGGAQGAGMGANNFAGDPGLNGQAAGAGFFLTGVRLDVGVSTGQTMTYANSIAGTGFIDGGVNTALNKTGGGTLVLTATNTFTGNVNISGGKVSVASQANLGSGAKNVVMANGTTFAMTSTSTFLATLGYRITGTGTFEVATGATATLSGLVADGTAAGSLNKTGAGTLILSGNNTYSGSTTVTAGTLRTNSVNAVPYGAGRVITIAAGATLDTNGLPMTLGGQLTGNGTVIGDVTFAGGSTYAVGVTPGAADKINIVGTANLTGGTVVATYGPGTYVAREHVILNATGGLGGTTFAALTGATPTGISQSLRYDANNVYLVIDAIYSAPGATGSQPTNPALNDNQQAVANALNAYFTANGGIAGSFVGLSPDQLTQIGGPVSTASVGAGMHAAGQFLDAMGGADTSGFTPAGDTSNAYAPLAYSAEPANLSSPGALAALGREVPNSSDAANAVLAMSSAHAVDPVEQAFAKRWAMWGSVYGSVGRIGGNAAVGSTELTARNWGIASGFERSFGNSKLGLSLGGAGSTFSLAGGLGSGSAGIFNAGIYGSHSFGNAYVSAAFGYGWNNVRTTRNVPGDTLTANYNAHTLAGRLETGYRFGSTSAITPYVALQGGNYFLPAYTETSALNGPFALAYGRQSEAFLRTELGARFEHSVPTSTGSLKFSARAAWAYNAINDRAVTAAFAALPGQTFTVNGARPARSAALLDLGMEANFDSGLSAKINFNGEFSRNVSAYGASAKLIYRW